MPSNRAVFLDRDGVLTRCEVGADGVPRPPGSVAGLEVLPGVVAGCAALRAAGFRMVCVTNQPDVARGTQSRDVVEAMNARLARELSLDAVRVCYHDDADDCPCRKPRPGMLTDAAREFDVDLSRSYMVGDRWRDVEAGRRAGCVTVLVDYGYAEPYKASGPPDVRVATTAEALGVVLAGVWRSTRIEDGG